LEALILEERPVLRFAIVLALLGHVAWALAGEPAGIATIVEGKAVVIRTLSTLEAVEGVRLLADDLVHTGKDAFLRIEYDDGTTVDVGAETRLQCNHPARRKFEQPGMYLLSGWLKITSGKTEARHSPAFGSPRFDVLNIAGIVVVHAARGSGAVFVEQGTAGWGDRQVRGATAFTLKAGEFQSFREDEAPGMRERPAPDFVAAMPRLFRDALPRRFAKFRDSNVVAKSQGTFSYAEVEPWVDAEPAIRHQFVSLWRSMTKVDAFRASLERGLSLHPEWGPVLYPPEPQEARSSLAPVSPGPAVVLGPLGGPSPQPAGAVHH